MRSFDFESRFNPFTCSGRIEHAHTFKPQRNCSLRWASHAGSSEWRRLAPRVLRSTGNDVGVACSVSLCFRSTTHLSAMCVIPKITRSSVRSCVQMRFSVAVQCFKLACSIADLYPSITYCLRHNRDNSGWNCI